MPPGTHDHTPPWAWALVCNLGEHLPPCMGGKGYCTFRAQSGALHMARVVRVLPVVAHLSSLLISIVVLTNPLTLHPRVMSCAQPFSHTTQSVVCHSPIPSAPAVLTSSIRHIFITGASSCRPHPVNFLESRFPFPDTPMGTAHLNQNLIHLTLGPISLLSSFPSLWPGEIAGPVPSFSPSCVAF